MYSLSKKTGGIDKVIGGQVISKDDNKASKERLENYERKYKALRAIKTRGGNK